jgi:uncharacterized protein (TIGR03382 family)
VEGPVDPDRYADLLDQAVGDAPADAEVVEIWAEDPDGVVRRLEHLLAEAPPPAQKPGEESRSWPAIYPGRSDGYLSGKAIYLSQCHGWIWFDSLQRFATQRGEHFDTVEDFHNPEALNQFLAPYLENAGAVTFTVKERDLNPNMAIADNDGEGYAESGSGFEDGPAGFEERAQWTYGTDPFNAGTTRRFPAEGGGVATWIPDVPEDGLYAVYVSWDSDTSHAKDAHYRITHAGGVIDRTFDQTVHGSTWQYVESLWLRAGVESLQVELIADSTETGKYLNADAVRVGGGMGDVVRHGDTSERPRWEGGAIQYAQFNGAPKGVYDPNNNGNGTDPTVRSRWAAWEHPAGEDALYLSWHSNACGTGDTCAARGTVTYIYDGTCSAGAPVTGSYDLAFIVNDELVDAFRALWEPDWERRGGDDGVAAACFAEVNPYHNPEMPAALVELAFHNNETDTAFLKHPQFRRDAARAMYRGIVRYFAERDGETAHYLPEPPTALGITHNAGGRLRVTWEPGPSDFPYGDPAESYLVQTSPDGRAWDNGVSVSGTATVLDTAPGETVYVKVAAVNAGGTSFPSEVVGARRSPNGTTPVLVVSGFDRFSTGLLPWEDAGPTGMVVRMDLPRVNPMDTAVAHGQAIEGVGWYFDTVSDEVFDDLDLAPYGLLVWVTGEESTADETFSDAQQTKVRAFVEGGGALLASGAEILWDLDWRGDAADKAFAAEVLGATYDTDDAGTFEVTGEGLLEGVGLLDFGEEDGAPYPVEYPDTLTSSNPVIARYSTGGIAAALGEQVALFGYPFETIGDPLVRTAVMERLLPALLPDYVPPEAEDGPDWERHEIPGPGCGCAGVPVAPGLLVPLLMLVVVRRRRKA